MDTHRGIEGCSLTKTRSKRKGESSDDSRDQTKKRKQNQDSATKTIENTQRRNNYDFDEITIAQDDNVTKTTVDTHRGKVRITLSETQTRDRGRATIKDSVVKKSSNVSQRGKETRGRGRSVVKRSCNVDKVSQRGKNTRGRGRGRAGRGKGPYLKCAERRDRRIAAAKILQKGRDKRGIGRIHQNMLDTMAENEREKRERRARDVRLLAVEQREQLPRNVKQNVSYVAPLNADSDDEFDGYHS